MQLRIHGCSQEITQLGHLKPLYKGLGQQLYSFRTNSEMVSLLFPETYPLLNASTPQRIVNSF